MFTFGDIIIDNEGNIIDTGTGKTVMDSSDLSDEAAQQMVQVATPVTQPSAALQATNISDEAAQEMVPVTTSSVPATTKVVAQPVNLSTIYSSTDSGSASASSGFTLTEGILLLGILGAGYMLYKYAR